MAGRIVQRSFDEMLAGTEALLESKALRPWPGRRTPTEALSLDRLVESIEDELLPELTPALRGLPSDAREELETTVGWFLLRGTAVLEIAGRSAPAHWITEAWRLMPEHPLLASNDPVDSALAFTQVFWLDAQGRYERADRILRRVERNAKDDRVRDLARATRSGPRIVREAPPVVDDPDFGVSGLYGDQDHDDGGAYTTTLFHCVMGAPIIPIRSYRVRRDRDGSLLILYRLPLTAVMRTLRWVMLGVVWVSAAALGIGIIYLLSRQP